MAPLSRHPGTPHLVPPQSPRGSPRVLTRVRNLISFKVFMLLLLGTAGIFCLAILFWKTGSFFRRFTRGRILRQGKLTHKRHIKTWYGWIPQEKYNKRNETWRKFWRIPRKWMSWDAFYDDYRWVWWDPTSEETAKHVNNRRRRWWLPKCLRSDKSRIANLISNPSPPADSRTVRIHRKYDSDSVYDEKDKLSDLLLQLGDKSQLPSTNIIYDEPPGSHLQYLTFPIYRRKAKNPFRAVEPVSALSEMDRGPLLPASLAMFLGTGRSLGRRYHKIDRYNYRAIPSKPDSGYTVRGKTHNTRKYRAWAARMQMGSLKETLSQRCGFHGRPGSPVSQFLSGVSEQTPEEQMHAIVTESDSTEEIPRIHPTSVCTTDSDIPSSPLRPQETATSTSLITTNSRPSYACGPQLMGPRQQQIFRVSKKRRPAKQTYVSRRKLTDSEVRLLHTLDYKLEWLLSECDPGRRAFHFALLPNHWLNRDTWAVYDPPCRVPIDTRRRYGDSRVNVPFPDPYAQSRRMKYPIANRRRAHTPRIDSWRVAVNHERKSSGLRDRLKEVELFDSSADEPPDGSVDPACWILRKPPQGIGMSTSQKNAYYEGGQGWHERLEDWQKVDRMYRIRKGIHEGKANRRRVKEFSHEIGRVIRAPVKKGYSISASTLADWTQKLG